MLVEDYKAQEGVVGYGLKEVRKCDWKLKKKESLFYFGRTLGNTDTGRKFLNRKCS